MWSSMDLDKSPPSPDEDFASDQNQRTSLHELTQRFVRLLQECEGGRLDLKEAVSVVSDGQKRRIYDITGVLEGIGLIVKMSKSTIKWRDAVPGMNALEISDRLVDLKSELKDLEQMESTLDQHRMWVEQSIRNTTEDCSSLTYVNHDDIGSCFSGHTLLAVRAPAGTQLDVPIPKAVQNSPAKYQIHLRSVNGPIDVVLVNKSSTDTEPVVLPVPPSEDILQSATLAMSSSGLGVTKDTDVVQGRRREILSDEMIAKLHKALSSDVFMPLFHCSPSSPDQQRVDITGDKDHLCQLSDI